MELWLLVQGMNGRKPLWPLTVRVTCATWCWSWIQNLLRQGEAEIPKWNRSCLVYTWLSAKGCRLGGNKGNCGLFIYVFSFFYDYFLLRLNDFSYSFRLNATANPNQLLTLRATGGTSPSKRWGTGMAFVENAQCVWKRNSWVAWAGIKQSECTEARHKNIPSEAFKWPNASILILFFGCFSVFTSKSMGLNRPQVQEGDGCPNTNKEDGVIFKTFKYDGRLIPEA